jgi:UDP-N-acetylmuramoylalanine--D-glutamate ligase
MVSFSKLKELSFLIYGLGLSGQSVVKFFKKNNIKNFKVWDDKQKKLFKDKRTKNLSNTLNKVDYIVLSPGISLNDIKNKDLLFKFRKKIITDIDLFYLTNKNFKSIVVTGTNGKSTTCKLISHLLKKNKFEVLLGGNIGTPILNLNIKKNAYIIIEASSFQLSHSKFICPDYAFLLNITNDHLDWHGSMQNYTKSKFKIFNLQKKNQFAIINNKLKRNFKKNFFVSKLIVPNVKSYKKIKHKIKNIYLTSSLNDENMNYVYVFSKLLKINDKAFTNAMKSFVGLPHRCEFFLKKKNIVFINDSKATSFEATKLALKSRKNIYWILGGLPKKNDKIILKEIKNNIVKCYLIGKNINFFKNQIKNKLNFMVSKNLKKSIIEILKDIKLQNKKDNTILLSPAAASYDQFVNFEKRGNEFKKLSKFYARKYI